MKMLVSRFVLDAAARNALLVVLSGVANGAGGFVFWSVAARLYPSTTVGIASAGSAMVTLLAGVSCLGFGVGMARYHDQLGVKARQRILAIFGITLVLSCLLPLVFMYLAPYLATGLIPALSSGGDVSLFVASCAATALSLQFDSYLMSRHLFGTLFVRNIILVVARMALYTLPHPSPTLVIAATGFGALVSVVLTLPFVVPVWARPPTIGATEVPVGVFIRFSLWNGITGLAQTMSNFIIPTLVITIAGAALGAPFYMAWSMINVLLLIPSAFSFVLLIGGSLSPASTANIDTRRTGLSHDAITLSATAIFVPCAIAFLYLLGRIYFVQGTWVLLALALGVWPNLKAQLLVTKFRLEGSQRRLALLYLANQLTILLASGLLVSLIGIAGAAIAWTVGQFMLFAMLRWSMHRTTVSAG